MREWYYLPMDLLRRLHRVIQSRLTSRDQRDPLLDDFEPWLDLEEDSNESYQNARATGEQFRAETSQDPQLAQWYANLEIPYGSDLDTAKKAWRKLMKRYHPDLHGADPEKKAIANELTRKLTEAYRELEKRL